MIKSGWFLKENIDRYLTMDAYTVVDKDLNRLAFIPRKNINDAETNLLLSAPDLFTSCQMLLIALKPYLDSKSFTIKLIEAINHTNISLLKALGIKQVEYSPLNELQDKKAEGKMDYYYIESIDGNFQSVFPEDKSEYSQLHSTIQDAVEYISDIAGNVEIIIKSQS